LVGGYPIEVWQQARLVAGKPARLYECTDCRRQTSITAGTVLHRSKLPLQVWFWAAHLTATHSNGMSALQLTAQLPVGRWPV
jgi:hypothetical protein